MNIPIQNIYYLLFYAWDRLEEEELVSVKTDDIDAPQELFARLLTRWVQRLIKRGLHRGYVGNSEEIPGIRGKLCVSESITRNTFARAHTYCDFDEFSADILHNQIIKSTIKNLLQVKSLNIGVRNGLRDVYRKLNGISEPKLHRRMFFDAKIHRNNRAYAFLISVCYLVFENLKINEDSGEAVFREFSQENMGKLFENFIRNFYTRHINGYKVKSERFSWQETTGVEADLGYLPRLETDTTLVSQDKIIIIETKFYPKPFSTDSRFDSGPKINRDHLFQLHSYLTNSDRKRTPKRPHEGILLYAGIGRPFDLKYNIHGYNVRVVSVDLNKKWDQVHNDLLSLVNN